MSVCQHGETLGSLLYPGFTHSLQAFQPTVELTERVLPFKAHQHRRTLWRLDAGFGSDETINWILARDYQLLTKGYNSRRAQKTVRQIPGDAWQEVRRNKWVAIVPEGKGYVRPTQTLALRWVSEGGQEKCALPIHTLLHLSPLEVLVCYDARGGMESEIKQDKLGLQLLHRRKHHWGAQEAWVILTDTAHNLLTWTHDWMWAGSRFETYGHLRLVQDVLNIPGHLEFKEDRLRKVALCRSHPLAPEMLSCLAALLTKLC